MKIPTCRGSCFSKLDSLGKRRVLFYSRAYIFQPLSGFLILVFFGCSAHIAKKHRRPQCELAKMIIISQIKCFRFRFQQCEVGFSEVLIDRFLNAALKVRPGLGEIVFSTC